MRPMVAPELQEGPVQSPEEDIELAVMASKHAGEQKRGEPRNWSVGVKAQDSSEDGPGAATTTDAPLNVVKTHDGVFANLSAKPQVMVLPLEDAPPVGILPDATVLTSLSPH